jgi:hypothetical protein
VLLLILTAVTFGRVVPGEFVLDDLIGVGSPQQVTSVFEIIRQSVTGWGFNTQESSGPPLYRPGSVIPMELARLLFGPDPVAFHVMSIAVHGINGMLVYAILSALFPGATLAVRLIGAAVFVVHPGNVEAVSWISAHNELLMTFFCLVTIRLYLLWRGAWTLPRMILCGFVLVLAVTAKEGAFALLFILAAYEFLRHRQVATGPILTVAAVILVYLIIRQLVIGSTVGTLSMQLNLDKVFLMLLTHLQYLFAPGIQPFSTVTIETPLVSIWHLCLSLTVVLLLHWYSRGSSLLWMLIGWVWILVSLWPAYAIALVEEGYFAGRHSYLASVAVAMMITAVLTERFPEHPKLLGGVSGLVLAGLAMTSIYGTGNWLSNRVVYEQITQVSPSHDGVRLALADAEVPVKAHGILTGMLTRELDTEMRIEVLYRLGMAEAEAGDTVSSGDRFREILSLDTDYSRAWVGLGNLSWMDGRLDEAFTAYIRAFEADPRNYEAAYNAGLAAKNLGRFPESAHWMKIAQDLKSEQ